MFGQLRIADLSEAVFCKQMNFLTYRGIE